jgi:hypothetical protein
VLQDKQSKLEETNQDLENKLSSSERQNTDLQNKLQQQLTRSPSSRASTPDRTSGYYEPTLNRMPTHRSRIPRTSGVPGTGSPTYTGNSNPVKMVQDMVGRVRVSCVEFMDRDVSLCVELTFPFPFPLELGNSSAILPVTCYAFVKSTTVVQLNDTHFIY